MTHPRQHPGSLRWRWPVIVLALLGGHTALMLTAVTLAVGDRSFAVVPDYYRKAVNWDDQRAAERRSAELGWALDAIPGVEADTDGRRYMLCTLRDAQGVAIPDATIQLRYYHRAHADTPAVATIRADDTGRYAALLPMGPAGVWIIDATAQRGDEVFVITLERVAAGPPRAGAGSTAGATP